MMDIYSSGFDLKKRNLAMLAESWLTTNSTTLGNNDEVKTNG